MIIGDSFKGKNYVDMIRNIIPGLDEFESGKIQSQNLPDLSHVITIAKESRNGMISLTELSNNGSNQDLKLKLEKLQKFIQADDPVNIQFTSGTTGEPKAAVLTHYSLINNADCFVHSFNVTSKVCLLTNNENTKISFI